MPKPIKNGPTRRSALKAIAGAAPAFPLLAHPPLHRDTIHLDTEHQAIDNFGASDCWSFQRAGTWSIESRNRIADLLFSRTAGIGLSCWRFNIGGGINPGITNPWRTAETFETAEGHYDWKRQAGERWFLGAAKARAVPQFLAFVNSPPGRMTRNGLTFCDKDGTTNLKPGFEGQYARYLVDILDHFRTHPDEVQRIAFQYVSPVNEPQWDWAGHSQEGMRASNADIKNIVRALARELHRRESPTELAILESGSIPDMWQRNGKATDTWKSPYGNYLEEFAADPSVNTLLSSRIGYHSYGSDRPGAGLVEHRARLGAEMKRYPGWKLWQTEYCILVGTAGKGGGGRDLTMTTALDVARIIHLDLTLAGASAWHWWTALSPVDYKDGLIYTNWQKPGDDETIFPSRLLWTLGNYSRFVRPGMRRVELVGEGHDILGLMGSAYKDAAARQVVAVYINISSSARTVQLSFSQSGRPWRLESIRPVVTSDRAGDELKSYAKASLPGPIEIPARSVVTLVAQFSGGTA
jgi:O-glycosyl hydrolase